MGLELPFLRMLMMEWASRKNWRVRSCHSVRPFAEEEEEYRKEFASAGGGVLVAGEDVLYRYEVVEVVGVTL